MLDDTGLIPLQTKGLLVSVFIRIADEDVVIVIDHCPILVQGETADAEKPSLSVFFQQFRVDEDIARCPKRHCADCQVVADLTGRQADGTAFVSFLFDQVVKGIVEVLNTGYGFFIVKICHFLQFLAQDRWIVIGFDVVGQDLFDHICHFLFNVSIARKVIEAVSCRQLLPVCIQNRYNEEEKDQRRNRKNDSGSAVQEGT